MIKTLGLTYLVQVYSSVIGIVLAPFYLHYLGPEGFGLVGVYIMLLACIPIFDIGLTPALSREVSRFLAGVINAGEVVTRWRTLELILGAFSFFLLLTLWFGSAWIGRYWLSANMLAGEVIANCVFLIGAAVVFRWLSGIQRAVLIGLERQDLVNGVTVCVVTLRFAGVLPILIYITDLPEHFFLFQVLVGFIELAAFAIVAHRLLPGDRTFRPELRALGNMLPMAGGMAFLTVMWVVMTQIDKLILSGLLSLEEFGHVALASMAASGVLMLVGPINQVVQPRLTILAEKRDENSFVELYRFTSQVVVVGFMSLGGGLALFSEPILLIWSGSEVVAAAVAPLLFWYGLANAVVGILVLPFMLQFARGRLMLHLVGNLVLLLTLVPVLLFASQHWGGIGAGKVFFIGNLLFLLIWAPLVHRVFLPELTWAWLFRDVLPVAAVIVLVLSAGSAAIPVGLESLGSLVFISGVVFLSAILGAATGGGVRSHMRRLLEAKE